MSRDYYQTLGINRGTNEAEIAKAYKKLALKWHPKLSKFDPDVTYHNFAEISEAYEVLGDPHKRAFYDKYGEEKLKDGFLVEGNFKGGYRFGGNPEEIFEKFFGTNNPFAHLLDKEGKDELGTMFGFAFGGLNYQGPTSIDDLVVNVECTLNELYSGCSKEVRYERRVLNRDGQTTSPVQESKIIEIKPGSNSATVIEFPKLGHEAAGLPNCFQFTSLNFDSDFHHFSLFVATLIFKIKELPHSQYKRKGDDLIYNAKIKLVDALCCTPLEIVTLDFRHLHIPIDQIITPNYVKQVGSEGMPKQKVEIDAKNFNKPLPKGELFIKFNIEFPVSLTEEQKNQIRINLPE